MVVGREVGESYGDEEGGEGAANDEEVFWDLGGGHFVWWMFDSCRLIGA